MATLNFGIMSIATVNAYGFLPSVRGTGGVRIAAVASRDGERARRYARENRIPRWYAGYDALLGDPDIDCVYIPLPNSLHAAWSIRALEAGKHVLCEKPSAANEAQARAVAAAVEKSGLIFMEGFHFRYHPLFLKMRALVEAGAIGRLRHIEAAFIEKVPNPAAVQFKPELAGGALMDVGCYCVSLARGLAGARLTAIDDCGLRIADCEVTRACARMLPSGVDGAISASLRFASGVTAKIECDITRTMPTYATLIGDRGEITVMWPFSPAAIKGGQVEEDYLCLLRADCGLRIDDCRLFDSRGRAHEKYSLNPQSQIRNPQSARMRSIRVPRRLSYTCQMHAFRDAVLSDRQPETGVRDAVENMRVIDAIYKKAGVKRPKFIMKR